ncbi:hypothetical protein EZS27_003897 [termite gut metagenome]|uniref:Uncharacterized protein n=1 Tax=termite gut metagenome TaxID=433724 RepID=A0A5J4SR72_9ZZZZ
MKKVVIITICFIAVFMSACSNRQASLYAIKNGLNGGYEMLVYDTDKGRVLFFAADSLIKGYIDSSVLERLDALEKDMGDVKKDIGDVVEQTKTNRDSIAIISRTLY